MITRWMLGCMGYPECKNVLWFNGVKDIELTGASCNRVR